MSILIRGMEMPKSCWDCPCYRHKVDDGYYDYDVCQAIGKVFNDAYSSATGHKTHIDPFKQQLDNCPLVPVPPHGRLIDADALRQDWLENGENEYVYDTNAFLGTLDTAPTILPAEEGEGWRTLAIFANKLKRLTRSQPTTTASEQ